MQHRVMLCSCCCEPQTPFCSICKQLKLLIQSINKMLSGSSVLHTNVKNDHLNNNANDLIWIHLLKPKALIRRMKMPKNHLNKV